MSNEIEIGEYVRTPYYTIEKAIEMIKEQKAQVEHGIIVMETNPEDYDENVYNDFAEWNKNAEIILNLIQTQQEEIEKKDKLYRKAIKGLIKANKIINSMADELIKNNIHKKYCYYVAGSTECSHNCKECIKEIIGGINNVKCRRTRIKGRS